MFFGMCARKALPTVLVASLLAGRASSGALFTTPPISYDSAFRGADSSAYKTTLKYVERSIPFGLPTNSL
jgi:hypothetical protein